jgi:hypothetical protein
MKTYRSTRKLEETHKTVSEAQGQTYAELYRKLNTNKSENDVYKLAKLRERKINTLKRARKLRLSWTTHLMTLTGDFFREFKSLR